MADTQRKYIGARYVPLIMGEWDSSATYEPLSVVLHEGNSYTSRTFVPAGVPIDNEVYWALSGNYQASADGYAKSYDTVADMQADTTLTAGMICHTLGFHAAGDGGAAWYKVESSGTANGMDVLALSSGVASLLINDYMCPVAFGATNNTDCSSIIQRMLNLDVGIDGDNKSYIIENQLTPTANVRIKNCIFDFNNIGYGFFEREDDTVYTSPTTVFSEYILIDNCEFKNSSEHVPAAESRYSYDSALPLYAKKVYISNSSFHDNDCNGLVLYADLTNLEAFEDVQIIGCSAYNNGIYNASTHVISKDALGFGAFLDANDIDSNIIICNCIAYHNANSGFAPHGIRNVVISDCISYSNNEHGFVLQTSKTGVISNCIESGNWSRGIRIQGDWNIDPAYCENVTVTNCICNDSRGIRIGGGVKNVLISNNIFNVNEAANYAVDFDPKNYPDSNIVFTGNAFNGKPTLLPFGNFRACDLNMIAKNNYLNGIEQYYMGYDLQQEKSLSFPFILTQFRPTDIFLKKYNMAQGAGKSGATFVDDVLTATSNTGNIFNDYYTADIKYLFVYVLGKILSFGTSAGTGWIRISLRASDNSELVSLSYNTEQITKITSKCNWGVLLDVDAIKKAYPTINYIRVSFCLTASGDSIELYELSVFTC